MSVWVLNPNSDTYLFLVCHNPHIVQNKVKVHRLDVTGPLRVWEAHVCNLLADYLAWKFTGNAPRRTPMHHAIPAPQTPLNARHRPHLFAMLIRHVRR